ncbi:hypothetical protein Tco_0431911 [Tanacetum coccineum]
MNMHVDALRKLVVLSFEHLSKDILVEVIKEKSILQPSKVSQAETGNRSRAVADKAFRMGYYWPTGNQDAGVGLKTCPDSHAYTTIQQVPKNNLILITTHWPFLQ